MGKVNRDVLAGIMGLGNQIVFIGRIDGVNLVALEGLPGDLTNVIITSDH
jgi:hypothetical protein